jgi:hypothetical protein
MESLSRLASELDDVETNEASTPPKPPPSFSQDMAPPHQRSSGGARATVGALLRELPGSTRRKEGGNDHGG